MGTVAVAVGLGSMAWAVVGRPEFGDVASRLEYLHDKFYGDRWVALDMDELVFHH
jgi:hypothetical protein